MFAGANWHPVRERELDVEASPFRLLNSRAAYHLLIISIYLPQFENSSLQVQAWERAGFVMLKSLIPSGIVRSLPWVAYSKTEDDNSYIDTAWYDDLIPDHKTIPKNELPS